MSDRPMQGYVIRFWIVAVLCFILFFLFFGLLSMGGLGELPKTEDLQNPNSYLATEVYTLDNQLLGRYFDQNRSNSKFSELPANLKNALLATEDVRFYDHTGVDGRAIMRVFKGVVTHDMAGGGSTITQQLAKNLFPREKLNKIGLILRKLKEWIIAVKLERSYTKDEIMTLYFNTVEFSDNAFGIKTAAKTYFNKPTDSLRVEESALLVGMLQAPTKYNPRLHPDVSLARRNTVLGQMYKYGYLNKDQKDSLQALPIVLNYKPIDHVEGPAPYFRMFLRDWLKDWCKKNKKSDGTEYNIYRDGLKVYTTLDSKMQSYAELSVAEHLTEMQKIFFNHWKNGNPWKDHPNEWKQAVKNCSWYREYKKAGKTEEEIDTLLRIPHKMRVFSWEGEKDTVMSVIDSIFYMRMFLQSGFLAVDPNNGYVKAWVGGISYKFFQVNHVMTQRQVGSTFKPFVYTVAIRDKGFSPCFQVPNQPVTFEKEDKRWHLMSNWTPHNSDGKYGGMLTLKQALANSINSVSAYLMHEMTPEAVITLVKDMGITSNIPASPSICLGAADISLFEMLGAYTTYANKGVYTQPIFVSRIEDKNGNILQEFSSPRKEVLDEQTAYVMIELMRGVVSEGTGKKLRYKYNLTTDIVGKTGTTQNQSDAWFIGLTPDLIAGVWCGCDDRFVRFRSITYGQGAALALPIWGRFFQKVYSDKSIETDLLKRFEEPENLTIELDCGKYKQEYQRNEVYGSEFDKPTSAPEKDSSKIN